MQPANELPVIDVDSAATVDDGTVLLDVREPHEWATGHAPTAITIPMAEIPDRIEELGHGRRVVCICRSGNRSARVTAWLRQRGIDALNMTGGMQAWASAGHPIVDDHGRPGAVI